MILSENRSPLFGIMLWRPARSGRTLEAAKRNFLYFGDSHHTRQGDIMAAPNTKDWSARENAHKPKGLHLLVYGQVEVDALNKAARLTKIGSKDPAVCALELTIVDTDEPGGDAVVW